MLLADDVKRKPYDLLDFFRNQFDRDFLEFNVNIHDLEIQLQVREGGTMHGHLPYVRPSAVQGTTAALLTCWQLHRYLLLQASFRG
jgi:hypothetical protein